MCRPKRQPPPRARSTPVFITELSEADRGEKKQGGKENEKEDAQDGRRSRGGAKSVSFVEHEGGAGSRRGSRGSAGSRGSFSARERTGKQPVQSNKVTRVEVKKSDVAPSKANGKAVVSKDDSSVKKKDAGILSVILDGAND